jgi:hypothetical protein
LRFDERHALRTDNSVADNVGWLDFSHALTFGHALRQQCTRDPKLWPQGLLQLALFVGRNSGYLDPDHAIETALRKWAVPDEAAFHDQFVKEIPLGYLEMRQAFSPSGDYGKWLRERPALVRINGIVFVHGGISGETAVLGCDGINQAVRSDLAITAPTDEQVRAMLASSETGPLWYRGLAEEPAPSFAPQVASILHALGARAIVIGHTAPAGFRIATRFDGRVIQIDTGMLGGTFYPGGMASALEIRGDSLAAIYPTGREGLPARIPALLSPAAVSALPPAQTP